MKGMNSTIRLRPGRATRPVAAALAVVLLGLSLSAGFHRGDHDDLGWLPSRFHHHDFQWGAEADGAAIPLVDHCMACHVSRTIVRFASPAPPLPATPATIVATVRGSAEAPAPGARFPHSSRAPPAS